jgi:hypothetical protein
MERGRHHVFECAGRIDCKMMLVACLQRQLVRVWLWLDVADWSDFLVDFGWDGLACWLATFYLSINYKTVATSPTPTPPVLLLPP